MTFREEFVDGHLKTILPSLPHTLKIFAVITWEQFLFFLVITTIAFYVYITWSTLTQQEAITYMTQAVLIPAGVITLRRWVVQTSYLKWSKEARLKKREHRLEREEK